MGPRAGSRNECVSPTACCSTLTRLRGAGLQDLGGSSTTAALQSSASGSLKAAANVRKHLQCDKLHAGYEFREA